MKREEFIRLCALFGLSLPLSQLMPSCSDEETISFPSFDSNYQGKILIVGAGAAGMAAAYLLSRYGIDFEIIEAHSNVGGRMRRLDGFADFPIDLGAEWIHAKPSLLAEIINDPNVDAKIDFVTFNPQEIKIWNNGRMTNANYGRHFYSEYKFKSTTWFGFFETYILPNIQGNLHLNEIVQSVDYSGTQVQLSTTSGNTYQGDKVLLTVPVKPMQKETISFNPSLPLAHTEAFSQISMGDGLKVFIEFKERFYPDILLFGDLISALATDTKTFYDAAFRKGSSRNVLGLFTINEDAAAYVSLGSDEAIIEAVLDELDEIFEGQARQHYLKHEIMNWSANPFVQGSYSYEFEGDQASIINALKAPIQNKVYFAGEALSLENQAMVHGAAESGYAAVEQMIS